MKHTRKNKDDRLKRGIKCSHPRWHRGQCGSDCEYCQSNRTHSLTKSQLAAFEQLKESRFKVQKPNLDKPPFHKEYWMGMTEKKGDWCGNGRGYSHSDFGWMDDVMRDHDTGKETFQNPNGFRRLPIIRCRSCGKRVRLRMRMSGYPFCNHDPYLVVPPHKVKKLDRK